MYSPKFYVEENKSKIHQLIQDYGFATILSPNKTKFISHLPFIFSEDARGVPLLISHFARANPHWRELNELGEIILIFTGPHAYISPAWYTADVSNVPTWNYALVHVQGEFKVIDDPALAFSEMNKLVDHFETEGKTHWKLPSDEASIRELMKNIVVFQVGNLKFEAKFKLSQKQSTENRDNVIAELGKNQDTKKLADYMKGASRL